MEDVTVHRLLTAVAESPAPPTRVDIARAARAGRRTRRVRWVAASSSAAAVVAGIAITAAVVAGGTPSAPPPPAASPTSVSSQAPAAFDPLTRYVSFPDPVGGAFELDYLTGLDYAVAWYEYGDPDGPEASPTCSCVAVDFVSAGHGVDINQFNHWPAVAVDQMPPGDFADQVDGHQAQWVTAADGTIGLRWEYAPGAWAEVSVGNVGTDPRALARRVASSVSLDLATRVRVPIDLSALPSAFSFTGIYSRSWLIARPGVVDAGYRATMLTFTLPGLEHVHGTHWPLEVSFSGYDDGSPLSAVANPNPSYYDTIVDGYPARVHEADDGGQGLSVFTNPAMDITTHSAEATAALPDGLAGLLTALHLRSDPAAWY